MKEWLTKRLAVVNGTVIGFVIGLAVYVHYSAGTLTIVELLSAGESIGGYAFGAASSHAVLSKITEYPLGGPLAGLVGGVIGALLALFAHPLLEAALPAQLITGVVAGSVVAVLSRLLPGL